MSKPDYLDQLIDEAAKKAGNDAQLAKMLHVTRQTVSHWRHGHKPCPAADQTLMASIAGLPPEKFAAMALVAQHQGTAKGELLLKALGKVLLVTGAAIVSSGANAAKVTYLATSGAWESFIRCIEVLSKKRTPRASKKTTRTRKKAAGFFSSV